MNNILYVDTSKFFANVLRDIGKLQKFEVTSTCSPSNALKILDDCNQDFDLLITALEFPNESGLAFIKTLRESKFKNIPIIVVSSHTEEYIKDKILSLGVVEYITKNISITRLIQLIVRIEKETFVNKFLFNRKVAFYTQNSSYILKWKNTLSKHNIDKININSFDDPNEILNTTYDVYILDSKYNSETIEEICLKIRQTTEDSIIFILFDNNDIDMIADFLLSGADDFMIKSGGSDNEFSDTNIALFIGKLYSNIRTYILRKELEDKNKKLKDLVDKDSLTKLYNHNYMYEALDKQISLSNRQNNNLTVIMFDIDNFKKVNDTFGHQIGDLVLRKIADLLTNKLRKSDIVGRYGGEEFLVILPDTDIIGGFIIAEKIRKAVSKIYFEEAKGLNITISGGAVQLKNHDALQLVKEADNLLYKAKNEGKNKICY